MRDMARYARASAALRYMAHDMRGVMKRRALSVLLKRRDMLDERFTLRHRYYG